MSIDKVIVIIMIIGFIVLIPVMFVFCNLYYAGDCKDFSNTFPYANAPARCIK